MIAKKVFNKFFLADLGENLLVGITVAILLLVFSNNTWLMEIEDSSMDWLMEIKKNIIPSIKEDNIPSIIMLDIDSETYRMWREPLFISHKHINQLIDSAVKAKAKLIIVTIDISQQIPFDSPLHPDDQALKDYLENYATECKNCPPIILKRDLITQNNSIPKLYNSFLDNIIVKNPKIYWATSEFKLASDKIIRRLPLWSQVCKGNTQPIVIPSIELVGMSILKKCNDIPLEQFQPPNCSNDINQYSGKFDFCGLNVDLANRWEMNQRIMYQMSWENSVFDMDDNLVLRIISAQYYTDPNPPAKLAALTDNIVIIGASYQKAYEIHSTPVGDMPSAILSANALHSLLKNEDFYLSSLTNIFIIIIFIIIISLFLKIFNSPTGIIVSGVIIIFGLLPLTMAIFDYGIWFDFAASLFAIIIYRLIIKYIHPIKLNNFIRCTTLRRLKKCLD